MVVNISTDRNGNTFANEYSEATIELSINPNYNRIDFDDPEAEEMPEETYITFENLLDFFKYIAEHYDELKFATESGLYDVSIAIKSKEKTGNYYNHTAHVEGTDRRITLRTSINITDLNEQLNEMLKRLNIIRFLTNHDIPIDDIFKDIYQRE